MTATIVIVVVVVAVAIAIFLVRRRSSGDGGDATVREMHRSRAPFREFHVGGGSAMVYFDVPLPAGEVDKVLAQLLVREAVEVLREKQAHDLPLDDIDRVQAFGIRDGEDVEAGSLSLESPGILPEIENLEVVPHYSSVPFDPLTHLGEKEAPASGASVPEKAASDPGRSVLEPIGSELSLTGRIDSGLRAQGLDPSTMSAGDMALGLMRMAGYTVTDGRSQNTYVAAAPGSRTYVQVVSHEPGDYPELDEQQIKQFQIGLATAGTDRGILVTEKYGPYMIYEAERRNPKARFITRERLQEFLDSFTMG